MLRILLPIPNLSFIIMVMNKIKQVFELENIDISFCHIDNHGSLIRLSRFVKITGNLGITVRVFSL